MRSTTNSNGSENKKIINKKTHIEKGKTNAAKCGQLLNHEFWDSQINIHYVIFAAFQKF